MSQGDMLGARSWDELRASQSKPRTRAEVTRGHSSRSRKTSWTRSRSRAITPSRVDSFVPREQIDERHLDSPHYITPNDTVGQEAFAVIRDAMRGKGMVALPPMPYDRRVKGSTVKIGPFRHSTRDTVSSSRTDCFDPCFEI